MLKQKRGIHYVSFAKQKWDIHYVSFVDVPMLSSHR
ncbi:hypothetical protein Tgr7_3299 [Thioalkalivibrio sulfidiphilus HL-EbGr7]|uniref:Uncharacterized protein n=1 Tax=Thioalkalivibrio sulfidiphilus (strain HL-EbGR7) TaxID=396588 RepID=B8GRB2_THISH|nr:hypothetical protein Tgr7_3299 [Thioalkalivibrio sulfidiphilus HL-EbGr7]